MEWLKILFWQIKAYDNFLEKFYLIIKLELRQYKNGSIQSKKKSNFVFAALFPLPYKWWKRAAIWKLDFFSTEWSRSYIVLALGHIWFALHGSHDFHDIIRMAELLDGTSASIFHDIFKRALILLWEYLSALVRTVVAIFRSIAANMKGNSVVYKDF